MHFFAINCRSPPRSRRPSTATEVRWEDQTDQTCCLHLHVCSWLSNLWMHWLSWKDNGSCSTNCQFSITVIDRIVHPPFLPNVPDHWAHHCVSVWQESPCTIHARCVSRMRSPYMMKYSGRAGPRAGLGSFWCQRSIRAITHQNPAIARSMCWVKCQSRRGGSSEFLVIT